MTPKHPGGRPKRKDPLVQITFKVDARTIALLDDLTGDLVAASGGIVNGGRAQALRRAIEVAHQARGSRVGPGVEGRPGGRG